MMTPEQLDEARALEAIRLKDPDGPSVWGDAGLGVLIEAARLAREGWTPTDPDLIEAREIAKRWWRERPDRQGNYDAADAEVRHVDLGRADLECDVWCALAAIKRGRQLERGGAA